MKRFAICLALSVGILQSSFVFASSSSTKSMDEITVIGSKEASGELLGSGAYVDSFDLQSRNIDDINRALRQVPGVYLREEDGYGNFPNISIRGGDAGRSDKVTVMEDGILQAPAPYSAPSSYYAPTTGRMHGIEVLKGSSQVKYGPQTTGGVVNYISTPVPEESELYTKILYGSDNEFRVHGYVGDSVETPLGEAGYLVEEYYRRTDGFKSIDETSDFSEGDETGFRVSEPMLKLFWEPNSNNYQRWEWKLGYTDKLADETYLGLSDADFNDDPYRRYTTTRFDNINTKQTRTYLQYQSEPWEDILLTVTGYFNRFSRDWFKLHEIRENSGGPVAQAQRPLSVALLNNLDVLKGQEAGVYRVRHNRRKYESWGIQSVVDWKWDIAEITHEFEAGVRYHNDYIRRLQRNEDYTQNAQGVLTSVVIGPNGGAGNRRQETDAWAFFLQDKIEIGKLTLNPGYRYESISYNYQDFGSGATVETATASGNANPDVWSGGVGANYEINEEWDVLGGVYRGFSVPGPRDNVRSNIQEETSVGYELGVRHNNQNFMNWESIFFFTDFSDLIVSDNVGGGGTGNTENMGDIDVLGLEFKWEYDMGLASEWGFSHPYRFSYTYTDATLDGDSDSDSSLNQEGLFVGGQDGNEVPYVPPHQFTFSTGVQNDKWSLFTDITYVDETYTSASNVNTLTRPDGVRDARFGQTDSFITVDIAATYSLDEDKDLVLTLENIFDEEYIVSRHPHGPRPGKPFTVLFGMEFSI